ncbi:MAG: FlgD immunoglobulin-like domain containing protein [Elusimicrobiota bacterium]
MAIGIPAYSTLLTINGSISGTAADSVGVAQVRVALQRKDTGLYFNWPAFAFNSAQPVFSTAAVNPYLGLSAAWSLPFADAYLTDQTSYYALAVASNPSNNLGLAQTTFTFAPSSLQAGSAGDGGGWAVVGTTAAYGCQVLAATVTFTAGPLGISSGGAIAVHWPDGWTRPVSSSSVNPPNESGRLYLSGLQAFTLEFNPPSLDSATLGDNWVVVKPTAPVAAGRVLTLTLYGMPAPLPAGSEPARFAIAVKGGPQGALKAIADSPQLAPLPPGPPARLAFEPGTPLTLTPLQSAPTMHIRVVDLCGASTTAAAGVTVSLSAGQAGSPDATAAFYQSGGGLLPGAQVSFQVRTSSAWPKFYYQTSTAGVNFELLMATATLPGVGPVLATRFVRLLSGLPALSGVSVDTGTLAPAAAVATMTLGAAPVQAFINFTLSDPASDWDVTVSTSLTTFYPPLLHRTGTGSPGRSLVWDGQDASAYPARAAAPGVYGVRILAAQGLVSDQSLRLYLPASGSIYGSVRSSGAFATVRAYGPGAAAGNYAIADSTGYFQIFGLRGGTAYNLEASTTVAALGQRIALSVSSRSVVAAADGVDIGSIPFPTPAFLRLSSMLPVTPSQEMWGRAYLHDADYTHAAVGTLHYAASSISSDDGAKSFGGNASSWTVLGVVPGTYELEVEVAAAGISTRIPVGALAPGTITDLGLDLARKLYLSGFVVLPATSAFNTWVSLEARVDGSSAATVFGGVSVPCAACGPDLYRTSAAYSLYGLSLGTWTVSARSAGAAAASSSVYISTDTGPLGMYLSAGGVIRGTVTVSGDTSLRRDDPSGGGAGPGFSVFVQAFNPATLARASARVRLSTSASASASTFTLAGLEDGGYVVTAALDGFREARQNVSVAGGQAAAALNLLGDDARLVLNVRLPGGPWAAAEFKKVSLLVRGPAGAAAWIGDMTVGTTVQYFASSAAYQSPPWAPGTYLCEAFYNRTGLWAGAEARLVQGATAALNLDFSGSTTSLRGRVALAGSVVLSSSSYGISVSSVAGLLGAAPTTSYCLLGSAAPAAISAFHMELLPIRPRAGEPPYWTGPLLPAPAGGCVSGSLPAAGLGPHPAHAYLAAIAADGSFEFSNLPQGSYVLRVGAELDGDAGGGAELAQVPQVLEVGPANAEQLVRLDAGVSVSGSVLLPAQTSVSRSVRLWLRDAQGLALDYATVSFNASGRAAYRFDGVPDGEHTITVQDLGAPAIYGARPRSVAVAGAALTGQDVALARTGTVRGRLALEQTGSDGIRRYSVVTGSSLDLLPRNFRIEAEAAPWFSGGSGAAGGNLCAADACAPVALDAGDRFSIAGLLPGTYEVRFLARNDDSDATAGGMRLVSSRRPGVVVSEGGTTDMGTVALAVAADLRGQVWDAQTGAGIAGVPVEARPALHEGYNRDVLQTLTDSSGAFILSGLDPRVRIYDLTASGRGRTAPGDALAPYETQTLQGVDLGSAPAPVLRLRPAPYSIRGRVRTAPGGPALALPFGEGWRSSPGALVMLQRWGDIPVDNPVADAEAQTDADGYFLIPALTTGAYKLTVAAQGYAALYRVATVRDASVELGDMTLGLGATLSGRLSKTDGSYPSPDEVRAVVAATPDSSEVLFADLSLDAAGRGVSGYRITGFRPGVAYRILLLGAADDSRLPDEARQVVFASAAESRALDIVFRAARPRALARAVRAGSGFRVVFELTQPLRRRTAADDDYAAILTTFSAQGNLGQFELSADRKRFSAVYSPAAGVAESSFTLKFQAHSSARDEDSLDPADPEFILSSTVAFYAGLDGYGRALVPNYSGGNLLVEGAPGRVTMPGGAFWVDISSCVEVTLQVSAEPLAKLGAQVLGARLSAAEVMAANLHALRFAASAYPAGILRAMAAAPPEVSPGSAFYDVSLPADVRTALAKPVQLTVAYSTSADPSRLNLYWYNPAANAYVLQQDVTGAAPRMDPANRTLTWNVNHLSTFVLFETGVAVISGNSFAGGDIEAFNFPNPFDLREKTVTTIHPAVNYTVRGTMIRLALPMGAAGEARLRIYNVAGERVRSMDLGRLDGGAYYYQPWDGRNDAGRDLASGVYVGVVKVGGRTKSFKMALIK